MDWTEINRRIEEELGCKCPPEQQRFRSRASNGSVVKQCAICGKCGQALKRLNLTIEQLREARENPVDEELQGRFWQEYNAKACEVRERWSEIASIEKSAEHRDYLKTPWWRARRLVRLEFDKYVCQAQFPGCGKRATEVHHLTYTTKGREPLWHLRSVCDFCHRYIHDLLEDPEDRRN